MRGILWWFVLSAMPMISWGDPSVDWFRLKEITTYPYQASAERIHFIQSAGMQIQTGMDVSEVVDILGPPDEVRILYAPVKTDADPVGHSYWYVVRRLAPSGSAVDRQEQAVRVIFDVNAKVTRVDGIGLLD